MNRTFLAIVLIALMLMSVVVLGEKHGKKHGKKHGSESTEQEQVDLQKEIEQRSGEESAPPSTWEESSSKSSESESESSSSSSSSESESESSASSSSSSESPSTESNSPPGPGAHTLVQVQIVSRHGTRAPNPAVRDLCPTDRENLARYGDLRLTLAGLTGTGQKELYALGVFTRQTYIERSYPHFLSSYFNDEEVWFRAVGEDRTIQSAVCMGQGMYPAGTAAIGYFHDLPSPVPVYTLPDNSDALLEVRKKDCAAQLKADGAAWDATAGMQLYRENENLVRRIMNLCNITDLNTQIIGSGDNYGDAIKDITDAWTFDMIEGFPTQEGLNYSSLLEFRTLAVTQLLGRIVGTEEQITYMNGELPERLAGNFQRSVLSQGPVSAVKKHLKMYAYHGHREMMYALGAFLGIDYDIKFPGLPKGAIPPATTLFFELHYIGPRGPNGEIPNAYEANGVPNPYLNRTTRRGDLPPQNIEFGAPLYQPWQPPTSKAKQTEQQIISAAKTTALYGSGELDGRNNQVEDNTSNSTETEPQVGAPDEQTSSILPRYEMPTPVAPPSDDDIVTIGANRIPPPPFNNYVVRAFVWHPCGDASIHEGEPKDAPTDRADCPAVPVKMNAICDEYECSMDDFNNKMQERIRRTGTWDVLCHVDPAAVKTVNADMEAAQLAFEAKPLTAAVGALETAAIIANQPSTSGSTITIYIFLILMAPLFYVLYTKHQARKMEHEMIEVEDFDEESESLAFNHAHPAARRVY